MRWNDGQKPSTNQKENRMNEYHDIYLRAHTMQLDARRREKDKTSEPKWCNYALVLDAESRITPDQMLTFGFWRFCELQNHEYVALEEGIFHENNLSAEELALLRDFARKRKAETVEGSCDRIRLYSRSKFIDEVLGISIQATAFIVCFNAGFDLSRIAADWETAANGGWSLITSQWKSPVEHKLQPNKFFPRIVVKALNSKTAIIHSTRAPMSEREKKTGKTQLWLTGRFLDLRTLLWALRNRSYSLRTACKEFGISGKLNHKPSGRVDLEEIEYCRQDVRATTALLNAAKLEFDLHPIAQGPDRMFSPASVAKSYLEQLNILHPSEKVKHSG
jgi:hypothetical protein